MPSSQRRKSSSVIAPTAGSAIGALGLLPALQRQSTGLPNRRLSRRAGERIAKVQCAATARAPTVTAVRSARLTQRRVGAGELGPQGYLRSRMQPARRLPRFAWRGAGAVERGGLEMRVGPCSLVRRMPKRPVSAPSLSRLARLSRQIRQGPVPIPVPTRSPARVGRERRFLRAGWFAADVEPARAHVSPV